MPAETPLPPDQTGKASPGTLAVLYDGECDMCRASIQGIRNFDRSDKIEPLDLHDPAARARFPALAIEDLMEELHVVNDRGQLFRGARAINEILRIQPGLRGWLADAWYIPGYAWLANRQYKRLAASRYDRDASGKLKKPSPS